MAVEFGIIGHGVVGSLFTQVLSSAGARVACYDLTLDCPESADLTWQAILGHGGTPCGLEYLLASSDCVLSLVTPQSCVEVAQRVTPWLRPGQIFVDLNSTSPATKRRIGDIVNGTAARFVEGVILGAVKPPKAPAVLLGGQSAAEAVSIFQQYGLPARFCSIEIGRAAAFKMVRSIFSKGVEAVLIETLVTAQRAGILTEIWEEIRATLCGGNAEDMLQSWVRSHAVSAGRRSHEMAEVSQFMEEIELNPVLPPAVARLFARSAELGISERFAREPESFEEVIAFLEQNRELCGLGSDRARNGGSKP